MIFTSSYLKSVNTAATAMITVAIHKEYINNETIHETSFPTTHSFAHFHQPVLPYDG